MAVTTEPLTRHVLVLDRIAHGHTVYHEESVGVDKRVLPVKTPDELAKRAYRRLHRDAHHVGGDLFVEVGFACECGHRLEQGPPLEAWARHAAGATGLPEAVLRRHGLARLHGAGGPTTAVCDCGREFRSAENPDWPAEALGKWAAHVEAVA